MYVPELYDRWLDYTHVALYPLSLKYIGSMFFLHSFPSHCSRHNTGIGQNVFLLFKISNVSITPNFHYLHIYFTTCLYTHIWYYIEYFIILK